ncbi:MAG: hypothetical protein IJJ82_07055 [Clostridia bacterium]|nr:hypothetical protein [Clostridia bacterium]
MKNIISSNTEIGTSYLILDEPYFVDVERQEKAMRDIFIEISKVIKPMNIVKHISFKTKDKYTTKQINDLIKILRQNTNILFTLFNAKTRICNILFISNKEDYLLKQHIREFLNLEEALNDKI